MLRADGVEGVALARAHQHQPRSVRPLRRQHVQRLALGAGEAAGGHRRGQRTFLRLALEDDPRHGGLGGNGGAGGDEFDLHEAVSRSGAGMQGRLCPAATHDLEQLRGRGAPKSPG
jgi:hypothetical protein